MFRTPDSKRNGEGHYMCSKPCGIAMALPWYLHGDATGLTTHVVTFTVTSFVFTVKDNMATHLQWMGLSKTCAKRLLVHLLPFGENNNLSRL